MRSRITAVLAVVRSPLLLRIELSFLAFSIAEWATWIAVVVYAYGRGGATEAGLIAFAQLIPSIVVAPAASALGDRFPRGRVLFGSYVLQAVAMAGTAVALLEGSPLIVYTLVTITATTITLTRPVQAALMPEIVATPDELMAANVASSTVEGAGALLGPILAGIIVSVAGPPAVFAATATGAALAAMAIVSLVRGHGGSPATAEDDAPEAEGSVVRRVVGELAAGVATVAHDGPLRVVVGLMAFVTGVVGALDIFYAVLAIDILDLGDGGIGFLGAATGFGALGGSACAVILVGRQRLAWPLLVAAVAFGGAIAAIAVAPGVRFAVVLLVVAGVGSSIVYVAIQTMTQRLAGDAVMSRVFGVQEALMMASGALGALVVPALLAVASPTTALVIVGGVMVAAGIVAAPTLLRADRHALVHAEELTVLHGVPMFLPLAARVLEQLAAGAVTLTVPDGATIVREGDHGDTFFVIVSGTVAVSIGGVEAPGLGPGDSFGEIALLRDVPRTATVRAIGPVDLLTLGREPFLEALTGQARSRSLARQTVSTRLAAGATIDGDD